MEQTVGVRELKARLSHYLAQVKGGATLIVTERRRPIARVIPEGDPVQMRLQALVAEGTIAWNGQRLQPTSPVAKTKGPRTVAELLLEDRK
ncbi:MAG TPA: type II toxin-antitoxin system prevent-host-death family antitoxin [Thermoflexia bacterium]|nr:type II toxin-antitoxin system prevent-host-death family antitoxin [Thermoflexia bacterium]